MKIKLALLDGDGNYLSRLASALTGRYPDKLELYSFTDAAAALAALESSRIDVFIADSAFDIDAGRLPGGCGFAYFVGSADIASYKDSPAVCKYQKVDSIYKAALAIFSETVSEAIGIRADSDPDVRALVFASPAGGVGTSSAAAACARSFASAGKRTLYLNLEQFGGAEPFFAGDGQADFGDVIFALKSGKASLSLKLESCVRRDPSGVFFFKSPKTALDMAELGAEDMKRLLRELKLSGAYDSIVADADFSLSERSVELFRRSSELVLVSDGSELANAKLARAFRAMELLDRGSGAALLPRAAIFYNKFSNKTGRMAEENVRTIGGAPRYERAETEQVVRQLVGLGLFQKI
ncbi:MAG: chromosome partitioning protein ParA [Oscillospiraceae bacterium]|jgi:cellulose biosynthesis protein BcsQ|nr:chromosome partitioning protein ParA [Oscillospiraceae bacterium]